MCFVYMKHEMSNIKYSKLGTESLKCVKYWNGLSTLLESLWRSEYIVNMKQLKGYISF